MKTFLGFALICVVTQSLIGCGPSSTSSSTNQQPVAVISSARLIKTESLRDQTYVLKADLNFAEGARNESVLFKGTRNATKSIAFAYHFVNQKRVTAAEADQAPSSCSFIVRTSEADSRGPLVFERGRVLKVADFGVMTSSAGSIFEVQLSQEFMQAFAIRCRNVIDANEFETQVGHLIQSRGR